VSRVNRLVLSPLRLIVAMALSVGLVAGLAYWDSARESAAALRDFAEEQVTLAKALGVSLAHRPTGNAVLDVSAIAEGLTAQRGRALVVLVGPTGGAEWRAADGHVVLSPTLAAASSRGEVVLRIARDDATHFGLPARTALAGLARIDEGLTIVAVASAERERDRERWAVRRLILSVMLAAGLVLVFGGLAVRKQRAGLTLEHQLALAGLAQQRDERLQRASKAAALGTLAMGVAHELSTPLGVIALRAEQLQARAGGDERTSAAATTILAQTERMRQIIRGLLGLARGDAPVAERVEPRSLVEQAIGLVAHRFEKAQVRLEARIDTALPDVIGDPRLLEHAVVNLLLNACDASPRGALVSVMATAAPDGAGVTLRVDDEGSGISPTDADRVMEPFFTTKTRGAGTGLGLALANEIVNSHRGTLTLAARPSGGTSAIIQLPPAEAAHQELHV